MQAPYACNLFGGTLNLKACLVGVDMAMQGDHAVIHEYFNVRCLNGGNSVQTLQQVSFEFRVSSHDFHPANLPGTDGQVYLGISAIAL
jgi:hypothetical protein